MQTGAGSGQQKNIEAAESSSQIKNEDIDAEINLKRKALGDPIFELMSKPTIKTVKFETTGGQKKDIKKVHKFQKKK